MLTRSGAEQTKEVLFAEGWRDFKLFVSHSYLRVDPEEGKTMIRYACTVTVFCKVTVPVTVLCVSNTHAGVSSTNSGVSSTDLCVSNMGLRVSNTDC